MRITVVNANMRARMGFSRGICAGRRIAGVAVLMLMGAGGCGKSATPGAEDSSGTVPVAAGAVVATGRAGAFTVVDLKPADGELAGLLAVEVKKARAAGEKPFVECTADWCAPCVAIKKSLDDPQMIDAFKGTYIIRLDVDAWGLKTLEGVGFDGSTIPVFYALDGEGKSTKRSIDGGAWGDNIPANMAPPLKTFFQAGR